MLKIEYLPLTDLKPYARNAKLHPAEQVEQIKLSIQEFGFNDPIAIWGDNTVIEGHGRLIAATEMGLDTVPVIRLDDLTDEQRKAYALVHNKLTMNSDFDADLLAMELDNIFDLDMSKFGFDFLEDADSEGNPYSTKVDVPQYDIKGEPVTVNDLYDDQKYRELVEEIDTAQGLTDDQREFLRTAASRHIVFNYRNIAEYYAAAPAEVQALMEKSALVIIDYGDAIKGGYVKLSTRLKEIADAS